MSTKPVTVYAAVCDVCGTEHVTTWGNPAEVVEQMTEYGFQWVRRGDELACDKCAEGQRWADCDVTFGGHKWSPWSHELVGHRTWRNEPHSPWMPEKDGKPRWRMRACAVCHYAEHQDEGGQWTRYRELEGE